MAFLTNSAINAAIGSMESLLPRHQTKPCSSQTNVDRASTVRLSFVVDHDGGVAHNVPGAQPRPEAIAVRRLVLVQTVQQIARRHEISKESKLHPHDPTLSLGGARIEHLLVQTGVNLRRRVGAKHPPPSVEAHQPYRLILET